MFKANVFEVKAKLSEYLERAARGERIVIYRHNTPVAQLGPVESIRTEPRPIGPLPGRPTFDVPASFFEPLSDEELDLWEGKESSDLFMKSQASKVAEKKEGSRVPAGRRRHRHRS